MNKKAWLRIVEAFIAIILIASVLLVLYLRMTETPRATEEIYKLQKTILDEIASDPEYRDSVLSEDEEKVNNFAKERIPVSFNSTVRICEVEDICGLKTYKEEVYASERVVSSTLKEYKPKKLKIFMWRES